MSASVEPLAAALSDRYRLERELGAGGMATVWLAEDVKHQRRVAVKVLREDLAASLGKERFLREISIAAGLTHPHILPLHDSGEAAGRLFYVMPYVDGPSLRQRLLRGGELPIAEAVRILRDVADAMAHAHRRGVVHRDLKPENVMLTERHALVTDFGVAKALSEATGRQTLTTAGVALGTPAYMSPEQATADPNADHRSDLYAFGVLAYELLTGRPPFSGGSPQEVLAAHVTAAAVPVTQHRASIPPALAALVMRCLEKKPADRPQGAEELIPQLEALLTPSGGVTPHATAPYPGTAPVARAMPSTRIRTLVAVGVLAIAVLGGFGVWRVLAGSGSTGPANRLAIAWFENRTGDSTLAEVGASAAEWLIDAFSREGATEVIPATYVRELFTGKLAGSTARATDLAGETRAALLISGTVSRRGDSLEYRAELLNARTRQAVASFGPFRGGLDDTSPLDSLQDRSLIAVLELLKARATGVDALPPWSRPRTLAAYREFTAAWEAFSRSDFSKVLEHLAVVRSLEPDFVGGYSMASSAHFNQGQLAEGDSMLRLAEAMRPRLTSGDIEGLEWLRAWYTGDKEAEYRAARSQVERYPGSGAYEASVTSNRTGRHAEALAHIAKRDTTYWGRNWRAWDGQHTTALHMLGRHTEELAAAIENEARRGLDFNTASLVIRALGALGRVAEIDSLFEEIRLLPAVGGNTAAGSLNTAGWELLAHGADSAAVASIFRRRLAFYMDLPSSERARFGVAVATSHLMLGQLAEARAGLDSALRIAPDNVALLGQVAAVAAMQGDMAAVADLDRRLMNVQRPFLRGANTVWRSRAAALAGNCSEAVRLLRAALAEGQVYNDFTHHWWAALGKARQCRELQDALKPRG